MYTKVKQVMGMCRIGEKYLESEVVNTLQGEVGDGDVWKEKTRKWCSDYKKWRRE